MAKKVYIFWDNSNIFISAKTVAMERESADAYYKVRVDFENMMKLAVANREVGDVFAVGSIPPELRFVFNRLSQAIGKEVELFERGTMSDKEQAVDQALQVHMLRQAFDNNGNPGIAVVLTGDGKGFMDGVGFHADLDRMHKRGWGVEILAWERTCNPRMRQWAETAGVFVPLENHYESVTFTDDMSGVIRRAKPLDLTTRKVSA